MDLSIEDISQVLAAIQGLECSELELTVGDLHVVVRRNHDGTAPTSVGGDSPAPVRPPQLEPEATPAGGRTAPGTAAPGAQPEPMEEWLRREAAGEVAIVRSPMVGTFYRAKEPGAPPFVEVGVAVNEDSVVCLVEVMKLFHSVVAGVGGVVERIFIDDSAMVEYGQPMVAIGKSR